MNSLNVAFPSAPVAWPPRSVDAEGTADRAGEWPNVPSPRSRADDVGAAPVAAESPSAYHALLGVADRVELEQGAVLYAPHAAMSYAFFPHSAVCSLLIPMMDGHEVEVGTVGYEGMLGLALFLGGSSSPTVSVAQIPGQALRVPADAFRSAAAPAAPAGSA